MKPGISNDFSLGLNMGMIRQFWEAQWAPEKGRKHKGQVRAVVIMRIDCGCGDHCQG